MNNKITKLMLIGMFMLVITIKTINADLTIATQLLSDVFQNTSFIGSYWIYQLAFLLGSLALITRKTSDWGELALPVIIGWNTIGFEYSWVFFGISTLIFVISTLGTKTFTGVIGALKDGIKGSTRKARQQRRIENISERTERIKALHNIKERYGTNKTKKMKDDEMRILEEEYNERMFERNLEKQTRGEKLRQEYRKKYKVEDEKKDKQKEIKKEIRAILGKGEDSDYNG